MDFFFSNGDFVSGIFSGLFQDSFIFGEVTSSHFFNYFNTTVNLSEDLFLQSSYFFFKELRFRKSHSLAADIFSEYLIFRNETSTEQPLCENRKIFRAVTFWNR